MRASLASTGRRNTSPQHLGGAHVLETFGSLGSAPVFYLSYGSLGAIHSSHGSRRGKPMRHRLWGRSQPAERCEEGRYLSEQRWSRPLESARTVDLWRSQPVRQPISAKASVGSSCSQSLSRRHEEWRNSKLRSGRNLRTD